MVNGGVKNIMTLKNPFNILLFTVLLAFYSVIAYKAAETDEAIFVIFSILFGSLIILYYSIDSDDNGSR